MADTLEKGALLVASRLAYKNASVCRGDIVLFTHPGLDEPYIVKRVIALPGETVSISDGLIYLNGSDEPLDEPYVSSRSHDTSESITVPDGCYFVLGDNRCASTDSRNADFGFVRGENIRARASFTLFPSFKKL